MRVPRIFHDVPLVEGTEVALDAVASSHLVKVLRLRPGAPLWLFDGRGGGEYEAELIGGGAHATVRVGPFHARAVESPLAVTLAQGISRGERMDYTLQKAVELGVAAIAPLETERCVVQLKGDRATKRLEHWGGVVRGACEQSGRTRLPPVATIQRLDAWLAAPREGLCLLLDPEGESAIGELPPPAAGTPITLLIGPEGGLAPHERAAARAAGYLGLRLGPRILRTETAAVAALAVLQSHWGDLA